MLGLVGIQGDAKISVNILEGESIYRNKTKISIVEIIYLD